MTNAKRGSVLLVDDDKFLVEMYGMKFSANGFDVRTSLSVRDALDVLRGGFSADCVIFDLVMPEQDGFSLLLSLSREKLSPNAMLVALTNQSNDEEKKKAEELGVDRYIVKASMIPSEVVKLVGEELGKKKASAT